MKRWLFTLAAALSLVISLAAATAWAMSHARAPHWRRIATAHSADLTRIDHEPNTALFATAANWPNTPHHGFWDAWWALSHSGRLNLLAQVIDYDGTLRRVHASPPSLTIDLPGEARAPAVVFGRMPESGPWANRLGFAFHSDSQRADDGDGVGALVSARAWMVTVPYWLLVLLGLVTPLLWLRNALRRGFVGNIRR